MNKDHENGDSSRLFQDIVWGARHDAFDSPLGRSLIRAWSLGACDEPREKMIQNMVRPLQTREAFGELPPFRKPNLRNGELLLGNDLGGDEVYWFLEWLKAGVLLAGNTGSGKSTLLAYLVLQIAAQGCAVWISEMYKTQTRHLMPLFARVGAQLIVLRADNWKVNLLQAGGTNPRVHIAMAVDLLVRVLDLPPRARVILRQACHDLYRRFSIWEGRTDVWPCLFDLYEWIYAAEGLNAAAREALLDRLGILLTALTPTCAAFRTAWNPVDLARYSIVFEMRGASEFVKQILLEPALFSLMQHEVEHGQVNSNLTLSMWFEDSQRFFDTSHRTAGGEITPMDELAGVIRGTGKGLGIVVQTMQGLSKRLVPNLTTKIAGRLGGHDDYSRLGADMAMNRQQIEWAKKHLRPGTFICQFPESDFREPFPFTVPMMRVPSVVTDHDAANSVQLLDSLPTTPAPEYADWTPQHMVSVSSDSSSGPRLSETELRFLKAVILNTGQPSSHYAKLARMSGKRAAEIRRKLIAAGFLREHTVSTGQRGRNAIVLEPLEPALAVVGQSGNGHGS